MHAAAKGVREKERKEEKRRSTRRKRKQKQKDNVKKEKDDRRPSYVLGLSENINQDSSPRKVLLEWHFYIKAGTFWLCLAL